MKTKPLSTVATASSGACFFSSIVSVTTDQELRCLSNVAATIQFLKNKTSIFFSRLSLFFFLPTSRSLLCTNTGAQREARGRVLPAPIEICCLEHTERQDADRRPFGSAKDTQSCRTAAPAWPPCAWHTPLDLPQQVLCFVLCSKKHPQSVTTPHLVSKLRHDTKSEPTIPKKPTRTPFFSITVLSTQPRIARFEQSQGNEHCEDSLKNVSVPKSRSAKNERKRCWLLKHSTMVSNNGNFDMQSIQQRRHVLSSRDCRDN